MFPKNKQNKGHDKIKSYIKKKIHKPKKVVKNLKIVNLEGQEIKQNTIWKKIILKTLHNQIY